MADTTTPPDQHPPSSPADKQQEQVEWVKDVIMWRKKRVSVGVLASMSVLWVVIEIYGYNFITVASWIAIFLFSSLFVWAYIYRIIYKEEPSIWATGISENTATEMAHCVRQSTEDAMRCVFKVGAQSEWYVFVATVVALWLLSVIGSSSNLLTLLFIGSVVGMSVPVIWVKYDYKIREHGKRVQIQSKRLYSIIDDKVLQKLKTNVKLNAPIKEKKVE
ncbi:hypothetical protein QVD17_09932 [Tagetes erecta]|uniref:Reticulon-like protein n=1 Tax=Tagetes erecta TaxID=13708 RepID=A0AAD8L4S6_TARER|nr:hypothetical protein QVD17_09932 [Tagetes erecta]